MTIRTRTLVTTGATLLAAVVALYVVLSSIVLNGFANVERQNDRLDVSRVLEALTTQVTSLNSLASDWANWNDTYDWVLRPTAAYASDNLNVPTLSGMGLNAVVYTQRDGRVMFAKGINVAGSRFLPVPKGLLALMRPNSRLECCPQPGQVVKGLVALPQGIMEVVSRPILTSQGTGPSHGTLLFGQWLEPLNSQRLQTVVHYPISLEPYASSALPKDFRAVRARLTAQNPILLRAASATTMIGYAVVDDVFGRPALLLRVDLPRTTYQEAQVSLRYLVLSLVVVGGVVILATFLLLERLVLARLARLTRGVAAVGAQGDLSGRVELDGTDELGNLAATFNRTLEALKASLQREEVLERQVAELRIEIDEAKKAKEVQAIVDTDYFRDLAERANDMRRRIKGGTEA